MNGLLYYDVVWGNHNSVTHKAGSFSRYYAARQLEHYMKSAMYNLSRNVLKFGLNSIVDTLSAESNLCL